MRVLKTETAFSGKWLEIKNRKFINNSGGESVWEYCHRRGSPRIVELICRKKNSDEFLLIKELRIPFNKYVIQFPAGLVKKGEQIEMAALRELKEETGYSGKIISVHGPFSKSAGLTDETAYFVEIEISSGHPGKKNLSPSEDIEVIWCTPAKLDEYIQKNPKSNRYIISANVWCYLKGFLAASLNSR